MKPSTLYQVIAHFFLLLFAYTGIAKFMEMSTFRQELASSPFLGSMPGMISWALPALEIAVLVALFVPAWRLKGLYASLLLMCLFTLYLVGNLFADSYLSCSCGGIIEDLSPKQHIFFNAACIVLAIIGIRVARQKEGPSSSGYRWLSTTLSVLLLGSIGWIVLTAATTPALAKTGFEGRPIPSFDMLLMDSVTKLNSRDIPTGKPFMVMSFSPYCPHCQKEIRDITRNMRQFQDTHIYLVTTLPLADLRKFYAKFQLEQYSNITAGTDSKNLFRSSFNWHMIPFTTVYDSRKRLVQAISGETNIATLSRCINN